MEYIKVPGCQPSISQVALAFRGKTKETHYKINHHEAKGMVSVFMVKPLTMISILLVGFAEL